MAKTLNEIVAVELQCLSGKSVERVQLDIKNPRLPSGLVQAGQGNFVLAADYTAKDVDDLLAQVYNASGHDIRAAHELLAAQILEPIRQMIPYVEIYTPVFFQEVAYGWLDDNRIPIEDLVNLAYAVHGFGQAEYTRIGGMIWTRPSMERYETAIDVPWDAVRLAGWNFLARQMRYAADALARKRDTAAQYVLDVAITANSGHYPAVATTLSKASVDAVIKAAAQIGFPVKRAVVNAGTATDMAGWLPSTTLAQYPQAVGEALLTNLYWSNYGNIEWFVNPFASTSYVYFGGTPDQIGWHQTRGAMEQYSDVDIDRKRDKYVIRDPFHAWYVGNGYTLYRLNIQ